MLSRRPEEQHISLFWLVCSVESVEMTYISCEYMHLRMVSLSNCTVLRATLTTTSVSLLSAY